MIPTGGKSHYTEVRYEIGLGRILFLSILSFGLYTAYWLYLTWQHYREDTADGKAYPGWHFLTMFVPVYGSFRAHAHLRTFGGMASAAGLAGGFSPGLAFFAILVGWLGIFVWWSVAVTFLVQIASLVAQIWMMLHAQPRINLYWEHVYGSRLRGVEVGAGEVIVAFVGVIAWLVTLASLFVSPEMAQNGLQ